MYNHVTLLGHCGQNAETRKLNDTDTARVTLATSDSYKKADGSWAEKTSWHNIVAFGNLAKILATCQKGYKILVTGKIQYRDWTNDHGEKKYITEIVVDHIKKMMPSQANTSVPMPTESDYESHLATKSKPQNLINEDF
jgi:single-strand DNA-binding protein